jgi:hypothetical protein
MPATTDAIREGTVLLVVPTDGMPDWVILPAHDDAAMARLIEAAGQAA